MARILFITGTDTGVGKTLLTAFLLHHLRHSGCHALAMKPFCSGSRSDVRLLSGLQDHELPPHRINPYFFSKPLCPLVAARQHRRVIRLPGLVQHIRKVASHCQCLLVEGAGGLLVPLGLRFNLCDLIARFRAHLIIVAPNKLGVINHTLLTIEALKKLRPSTTVVVLMGQRKPALSATSNPLILAELLSPIPVFSLPHLGPAGTPLQIRTLHTRLAPSLEEILNGACLSSR